MRRASRFTAVVLSLIMLFAISATATVAADDTTVRDAATRVTEFLK